MNIKIIKTIAQKEFLSYINSSTAYILIVPFLLISFFLFFRQALIANSSSLRPFFELLPYLLLFLAPAISMRTFAQEQQNNTLELLFAHPVSEWEIVTGKFGGRGQLVQATRCLLDGVFLGEIFSRITRFAGEIGANRAKIPDRLWIDAPLEHALHSLDRQRRHGTRFIGVAGAIDRIIAERVPECLERTFGIGH